MNQTSKETFKTFDGLANLATSVERELRAVAAATTAMQAATQQIQALPGQIQTKIENSTATTVEEETKKALVVFNDAAEAAAELKTDLLDARQSLYARFGLWVFGLVVVGCVVVCGGTALYVPSPAKIQDAIYQRDAVRQEVDRLQKVVDALSKQQQSIKAEVDAATKRANKWKGSLPHPDTFVTCTVGEEPQWCIPSDLLGESSRFDDNKYYTPLKPQTESARR